MKFFSNLLAAHHDNAKMPSKTTATTLVSRRRHGVSWCLSLFAFVIATSCFHNGPHQLVAWAQSSSANDQCVNETVSLEIDVSSYFVGVESVCNDNGCVRNYTSGSALLKTDCNQLGATFYVYDQTVTCDFNETGGTATIFYNDLGDCVGSSCTESFLNAVLEYGLRNVSGRFVNTGLTNCVGSITSLTLTTTQGSGSTTTTNTTLSPESSPTPAPSTADIGTPAPTPGNTATPPPPSSPPSSSGGNNSPAPSSGGGNNSPSSSPASSTPVLSPASSTPVLSPVASPGGAKASPTSGGARPLLFLTGAFATGFAAAAQLLVVTWLA